MEHFEHLLHKHVVFALRDDAFLVELEQLIEGGFAVGQVHALDYLLQKPI